MHKSIFTTVSLAVGLTLAIGNVSQGALVAQWKFDENGGFTAVSATNSPDNWYEGSPISVDLTIDSTTTNYPLSPASPHDESCAGCDNDEGPFQFDAGTVAIDLLAAVGNATGARTQFHTM